MSESDILVSRDFFSEKLKELEQMILKRNKEGFDKIARDQVVIQNRIYSQLESLSWLQRRLKIKGQLPPLRGWAASPDVLLRLHDYIIRFKPRVIVELGSGASTLVIADALQQNGIGKLFSIDHSEYYGAQTLKTLQVESLEEWVDLRVGALESWEGRHLNPVDAEKPSLWYPISLLADIDGIDLLWVDGPPGSTCLFSRYPAVPALADKFSDQAEVWLDDTGRQEEKDICESWAADYGIELSFYPLEKGLGRLIRSGGKFEVLSQPRFNCTDSASSVKECELDFDFGLSDINNKG
ncbi:class I SAM-dependent methyltransferase [Paenalcaligenes faecalis]|uniref:class I SAM-dependent methyltransferase n=1 Tax=Paenalcaligenes faecalis TaxID=2980099 RepID=UPI0022B9727B|nr:class I SAM-dependent methyltransferase [Paenalcaligenes faecalis]